MKECNSRHFFCCEVDGNLGICKYTSDWCKNNRGWFPSKDKWLNCNKLQRFWLWTKYWVKRIYRDIKIWKRS